MSAAAEHLAAGLVDRPGSGRTGARALVSVVLGLVTGDADAGLSGSDLVVTRLDTGAVVLRVSAGGVAEADRLLQRVRLDLETKSVTEFLDEWRLIDDAT